MNLYKEAIRKFSDLYDQAQSCGLKDPTAMTLATADKHGRPTARVVLLKGFDDDGFVFYTNLESRKGDQLKANPQAALCFHWPPLEQQVSIEGTAKQVSDVEADAYWATRPRESRIGAWASHQSHPLDRRETLEAAVAAYQKKFPTDDIPRPAYWTGFRVIPQRIEFWKLKPFRLHERIVYEKAKGGWTKGLLFP
jgi:pyridoxamine 5'-phosphate oxidase